MVLLGVNNLLMLTTRVIPANKVSMSGRVTTIGNRKKRPVTAPIGMDKAMAFGT